MNLIIKLFLILSFASVSYSQSDTLAFIKDEIEFTPKNQFTFTFGTNFHQKMRVESFGTQMLFAKNAIVPKFGIGYKRHITSFFSIETGIEITSNRIRYNVEIPGENFSFEYENLFSNVSYNVVSFYVIPIHLDFNLFEWKKTLISAGIGAKFNFIPAYKIRDEGFIGFKNDSDPNNDSLKYSYYQTFQEAPENNTKERFVTFCARIGASRYYPKTGLFSVYLSLNITPSYISEGVFLFNDQILPTNFGFLTQYNNYVGVDFSYAWVKSKKVKPARFTIF